MKSSKKASSLITRFQVSQGSSIEGEDWVATEEPLEIRVNVNGQEHGIAITMRTPGHDSELAIGFLYSEAAIAKGQVTGTSSPQTNQLVVHLREQTEFDVKKFSRHVFTSSSCGVCGKTTIDQLTMPEPVQSDSFLLQHEALVSAPTRLRAAQATFHRTGGLHAAAVFDQSGNMLALREDVGRHNAVDKLIGSLFMQSTLPANDIWILVSGRASFELVQKAAMAGLPLLAAIGAPSSLAVELAQKCRMTLVGFLASDGFNIYCEHQRIKLDV